MAVMHLRVKLLLTLAALVALTFFVILVATNAFVLPAFQRAEAEEVDKGLTRALNAINISISQLESYARDWAYWDDAYDYLQNNNSEFLETNVVPGTFESLEVNVMLFLDPSGKLVFGKSYDYANRLEIPIPGGMSEKLDDLTYLAMQGGQSGILMLPEGAVGFSVQPVLKSSGEGPPAGALFMGRFLGPDAEESISKTILLPVSLRSYSSFELPVEHASAKSSLESRGTASIPINSSTILGYAIIKDVFDNPSLVLEVTLDRDLYRLSLVALTHSVSGALISILVAFTALYIAMEMGLLRKIIGLREELMEIGKRKDFSRRVQEEGNDEISDLAKSANWMLSSLESSSEELKRYAANLEELVEAQTARLREKERLAAIGETATMVGHDLRNPLQSIMNIVYLMEADGASLPPDKSAALLKWIKRLKENVIYMDKIVSDLQDLTRNVNVDKREVRLDQLFNDVLADLKIPENVRVGIKINPGAERAITDPLILKRILQNLVNNAFQAMPDGGSLTIEASVSGGELQIAVQDTGLGMNDETLKKIFTPLFTTKAKGTGLGLAVCKRLTEELGGTISVKSTRGEGTTFILRLPISGNG
ncbi:MAG: CHASE4 domain-containing protein [Candidatus Methanosuratincola sp.]